ncbi:hypothetical protein HFO49_33505 [Rhizobium leguminosarum]|uniref:hypothetical protein n=1 Tax=Rhizobium leguminosarum TaxID=384 RepID=UPI001C953F2D|nr:hypothetical protein [Rhizobium leguminosarum]MBY5592279.1 hypothetical protein [Rhizobium leguminosarum]MBY5606114.1 hypothetical protein [Rhizobium leguminosarum]
MSDLIVLIVDNGAPIRCTDLDEAKFKAVGIKDGRIVVEITPDGGGPMTTLEFDRGEEHWVPI